MITKGIRIWITAERDKWEVEVPHNIASRCEAILTAAFQELIDNGVIDIATDVLDEMDIPDTDA